ncbi:hypothetical protein EON66_11650, partial [archaeon]
MLRAEYRKRGYEEVMSPLIFKQDLWRISGHLQNYAENMFTVLPGMVDAATTSPPAASASSTAAAVATPAANDAASKHDHAHAHHHACGSNHDDGDAAAEVMGLKPMNCPGHCLIFAQVRTARLCAWWERLYMMHWLHMRLRVAPTAACTACLRMLGCPSLPRAQPPCSVQRSVSYRELPMRLADFSSLHRNEATGALGGLTRLRRFQQDDAHIFCDADHIQAEVRRALLNTGCLPRCVRVRAGARAR